MFTHFILTRFNVQTPFAGQYYVTDEKWMMRRFDLFDRFCYPSVNAQRQQDFKWLVFFDENTPDAFKTRINTYGSWAPFIPCFTTAKTDAELRADLKKTIQIHLKPGSRYLITTRLDNDDGVAKTFVEQIQRSFANQQRTFINFPNGYLLRDQKLYMARHPSSPFLSLIEECEQFVTVWHRSHVRTGEIGTVQQIETAPIWLQVIHQTNVYNRVRYYHRRVPVAQLSNTFKLRDVDLPESESHLGLHLENTLRSLITIPLHTARYLKRTLSKPR